MTRSRWLNGIIWPVSQFRTERCVCYLPVIRPVHRTIPCQARLICLFFFLLAGRPAAVAQCPVDSPALVLTRAVPAALAAADHLGNLYIVGTDAVLEKYARDGRLLTRYANNRLGRLTALDVSNPLKILVWYGDFRTAVFLDRSLTPLGEQNFLDGRYADVRVVAMATDGNVWIYDEPAFTLRKLTPEGEPRYASQALNLLFADPVVVTRMLETDDLVLAFTQRGDVLIFDQFAQYRGLLAATAAATPVAARGRSVYYRHDDGHSLVVRDLWTGAERPCVLPAAAGPSERWDFTSGGIFRYSPASLTVFNY
jgi:hypothetical protein